MRPDAVRYMGRLIVPTSEATLWVADWAEFKDAKGVCTFSEDQTEITLSLPEPYKFSIGFYRQGEA